MGPEDLPVRIQCEELFPPHLVHVRVQKDPLLGRQLITALDDRPIGIYCREVKLADSPVRTSLEPFLHIRLYLWLAMPVRHVAPSAIRSEEGNDPLCVCLIEFQCPVIRRARHEGLTHPR